MAPFARQDAGNAVIGIDAEGLVQSLMLFDHCIIPTIWLKDVQFLLRMVNSDALCELIDNKALSFYIDSSTGAEMGQARSSLNLTGNTTHLRDNEFSFSVIKGSNDPAKAMKAIDELAATDGVSTVNAKAVAERVEAAMLEPRGIEIHNESFKQFYKELRTPDSTVVHDLIACRLRSLGAKSIHLEVNIEEFVEEDFRVNSNLTTTFGLSSRTAREISLRALLDLLGVYIRLVHMREFSCILGMNKADQSAWQMKVDALVRGLTHDSQRDRQFTRVAKIAGLGERQLVREGTIDLRRLISLRQSEDLMIFRSWLKQSDTKSDEEIRDRVSSIRRKIGNAAQKPAGKMIRLMLSGLTGLIPDLALSGAAGLAAGAADALLFEKIFRKDPVVAVLGEQYPSIIRGKSKNK